MMTKNSSLKQELYEQCLQFVDEKLKTVERQIKDIQESLTSETKSSAGDKHETGRAMLQLEREKAGQQLAEIENTKMLLTKIDSSKSSKIVGLGSAIFTTGANYFLAVSAGVVRAEGKSFYAISPNTPIGLLLKGKRKGDKVEFREASFEIESVI